MVGSGLRAPFTLMIRPAEDGNDAGETDTGSREGEPFHHVFATNASPEVVASGLDRFARTYRRRLGIETALGATGRCGPGPLAVGGRPGCRSAFHSVRILALFVLAGRGIRHLDRPGGVLQAPGGAGPGVGTADRSDPR